jgi:hypothetical protein
MKTFLTGLSAASALALMAGSAYAGPPTGVPVGPPAGIPRGAPPSVPHGPPPVATTHIPTTVTTGVNANASTHASTGAGNASAHTNASTRTTVTATGSADFVAAARAKGDASLANGAAMLGKLNAAHASDKAFEHASAKSTVGALATYKSTTLAANADVSSFTQLITRRRPKPLPTTRR